MSSLTSKLQPTLTPPPQQRKNKITMPQLYSIVHFDSSGQTEISSDWCSSQNKTIKLLLMGSFYKAYFARESYLRSNCENKKELAQRSVSLLTTASKSQLKEAPEKAEVFCLLWWVQKVDSNHWSRLSSFTRRENESSRTTEARSTPLVENNPVMNMTQTFTFWQGNLSLLILAQCPTCCIVYMRKFCIFLHDSSLWRRYQNVCLRNRIVDSKF